MTQRDDPDRRRDERERVEHPEPYLQAVAEPEIAERLRLERTQNPLARSTLADTGLAVLVGELDRFGDTLLIQPFDPRGLVGIEPETVRVFRVDEEQRRFEPVWRSGTNVGLGYVWAEIRRAGTYVAIGLPRDRVVQEALRGLARERRLAGEAPEDEAGMLVKESFRLFTDVPPEAVDELRRLVGRAEIQSGQLPDLPFQLELGTGGHVLGFPLPGGLTIEDFRKLVEDLEVLPGGLPEEQLFYPPDIVRDGQPPWPLPARPKPWEGVDWRELRSLVIWRYVDLLPFLPWLFSQDWWMYQHDRQHTGRASGLSDITSSNVGSLHKHFEVSVDGPVYTKPSIADGKVYVGTSTQWGGGGGTLYKIDLSTGNVDGQFHTTGSAFYSIAGIGGSPAVVGGRVYFTTVYGQVYCLNAATMNNSPSPPPPIWVTDLKHPNQAKNQPVNNHFADSWSGPLVVNGKVYVGCGEGEEKNTYGFVYCLDAATGRVIWLFCTCKFDAANRLGPGSENVPNRIPASVAVSDPLPQWAKDAGYSLHPDPLATRETGCSVWSSCAYDAGLNRIYVGTGNSQYVYVGQPGLGTDVPDEWYGSGLISLDADTGQFRGFFQPAPDDSYWPGDFDIDVPGSATIYRRGGQSLVGFGSKNGSVFLLDADTLAVVARRQLLPRAGGSGLPGNRGTAINTIVPTGGSGENKWGVMATPALHAELGRLFVALGGYDGIGDGSKTPFLRAVDWGTLADAWPTATGADGVSRYTTTSPPMYLTNEAGLSSPAVVNDVVFVSTDKTALYALSAASGHCRWSATGLPSNRYALGPAISGNYVVMGAGNAVHAWKLTPTFTIRIRELELPVVIRPLPGPDPLAELITEPWPGADPLYELGGEPG